MLATYYNKKAPRAAAKLFEFRIRNVLEFSVLIAMVNKVTISMDIAQLNSEALKCNYGANQENDIILLVTISQLRTTFFYVLLVGCGVSLITLIVEKVTKCCLMLSYK